MKAKTLFKILKKVNAFTFLELIIVIGIIAILIAAGTVSYSTSQKKARDSKRKSDIANMRNALEQYYAVCGLIYPSNISSGVVCTTPDPDITIIETDKLPKDPATGAEYTYTPPSGNDPYSICATLEAETPVDFCFEGQQ